MSRVVERARNLMTRPGAWLAQDAQGAYALRLSADRRSRVSLTLNEDEFRALSKELGKSAVFITHDLDEAIRIGDRIAIMKDGVLVQTGTPEQIVTEPADDYVAEFVAGISKLDLVTAARIMAPLALFTAENPGLDLSGAPVAAPADKLNRLVDLAVGTDHPILVQDDYPVARDDLYQKMKDIGIHPRRYFYPLISEFPMYRGLPSAHKDNLPVATAIAW